MLYKFLFCSYLWQITFKTEVKIFHMSAEFPAYFQSNSNIIYVFLALIFVTLRARSLAG